MKTDVLVPEVGESITQGVIAAWLKDNGEKVDEGEDLFELDTDKATLAVPSPAAGVLTIMTQEGADVAIGQVVAAIETVTGGKNEKEGHKSSIDFEIKLEKGEDDTVQKNQKEAQPAQPQQAVSRAIRPLGPAARRLVEQYEINPLQIAGTGKDGRITKMDIILELEKKGYTIDRATGEPVEEKQPEGARIESLPMPDRQNRVPMTTIRKRIAENLLIARQNAAHVTTFNEIDMSKVIEIRRLYKESFEKKHDVRIGFMSFFVKACCNALALFPVVNGRIEGDDIVYNNFYNIGIAVSTERGLVVPVIRDADTQSFAQIKRHGKRNWVSKT
jgi:2-oxoglutarate dehydrogenase E2 component (dihydrolipoamide succinyltransferase)